MPVTDEIDMVEFGRLIGVQTDPGKDPITWLDEMRVQVGALQAHLGGLGKAGPAADAGGDEEVANLEDDVVAPDPGTGGNPRPTKSRDEQQRNDFIARRTRATQGRATNADDDEDDPLPLPRMDY